MVIEMAYINDKEVLFSPKVYVGGGGSIEIDQTYNPESENAQSGKAVAEAVVNKMDKFGEVTKITNEEGYTQTTVDVGEMTTLTLKAPILKFDTYGYIVFKGGIASDRDDFSIHDGDGYFIPLNIGYPTDYNHAATKAYVDNAIGQALEGDY